MKKKIKFYAFIFLITIIAIVFILNKFLLVGILIGVIGLIIYLISRVFVNRKKTLKSTINKVNNENYLLKNELEELRNRKFNITKIKDVLELNFQEIETTVTRLWNYKTENNLHFFGALKYNVNAKYGIDLTELKIKVDSDSIKIANVNPKFLSFSELKPEWKICELTETKTPVFGAEYQRTSDKLEREKAELKTKYQDQTYNEIKQGPEELKWIIEPLKEKIENSLKLFINSNGKKIKFVDDFDDSYILLNEYTPEK